MKFNKIIEIFRKEYAKKLVVPKKTLEELTCKKKCGKETEEKLYKLFKKQDQLIKAIRNRYPEFSKEENEKLWDYMDTDKYPYLKDYCLSSNDRTILATALVLAETRKCALLTNDSGIIKAALYAQNEYDPTNSLKENLKTYPVINSTQFHITTILNKDRFCISE